MLTVIVLVCSNSRSYYYVVIVPVFSYSTGIVSQKSKKAQPSPPRFTPLGFLVADKTQLITDFCFVPAIGKKRLYHVGILFLYCITFWLVFMCCGQGLCVFSQHVVQWCCLNKSFVNNYTELLKQKLWAKGWVQDVWPSGCPSSLLTQQLFQSPPPGPGSVRSLMESAGSKLTHVKRANKSLQLLVSAPGRLARPHSLIGPHPTFHTSPREPHFLLHGYRGAYRLR